MSGMPTPLITTDVGGNTVPLWPSDIGPSDRGQQRDSEAAAEAVAVAGPHSYARVVGLAERGGNA